MKRLIFIFLLINAIDYLSFAQGCSDAGICTINTIKDQYLHNEETSYKNTVKAGLTYGIGEYDLRVTNPYTEISVKLLNKLLLAGKIGYSFNYGELANTNNLSDLILTGNYDLYKTEFTYVSFLGGIKIPLNNANTMDNDSSLPMHYQSSMGTYDLLLAINYVYQNFGLTVAYQQPIINANENEFLSPDDLTTIRSKYYSTNMFERKSDLMGRLSYKFSLAKNRLSIKPSLLGIYHLDNDTYIDGTNVEQEILGSKGLTLNFNVFLNYHLKENKQIELSFGTPFITRDTIPDGLTRKLVVGLEYIYSF